MPLDISGLFSYLNSSMSVNMSQDVVFLTLSIFLPIILILLDLEWMVLN